MKITVRDLKKLIRESVRTALKEGFGNPQGMGGPTYSKDFKSPELGNKSDHVLQLTHALTQKLSSNKNAEAFQWVVEKFLTNMRGFDYAESKQDLGNLKLKAKALETPELRPVQGNVKEIVRLADEIFNMQFGEAKEVPERQF